MAEHTQESLDDISFRDLQKLAKDLELSAQGGRDDITARILAHQDGGADEAPAEEESTAPAEVPADETPAAEEPPAEVPAEDPPTEVPAEEPQRAREDNGQYAGDDEDTQPDEAYDPPAPKPLTPRAITVVGQTVAGYIGVDAYTKAVEKKVVEALEAGKQPCVVEGKGNARFEVEIFDKIFDKADFDSDVVARRDGVVMNIARRLADANLFPSS